MSSSKHLGFAILAMLVVIGLGGAVLAWPSYREAGRVNAQAEVLRDKGESYSKQTAAISHLTAEYTKATARVKTELKTVPDSPDIAGLMRMLSLPVDGANVRDQTFTAGQVKEAVNGSKVTAMVAPLTVEMDARFDSIFAMIRLAESMQRLLRVRSVNVVCERQEDTDARFARATIVFEAVYEPGSLTAPATAAATDEGGG